MLQQVRYSLNAFKDEACELVRKGVINCRQPIYMLCPYFSSHEWELIECELESNGLLLKDPILDLIGCEGCRYSGAWIANKYCDFGSDVEKMGASPMRSPESDCCAYN